MANDNQDLRDYEKRIHESSASLINADGSPYLSPYLQEEPDSQVVLQFNPLNFHRQVDILANEYGLGGCRSLSEYAEMINKEDPQLVEGLLYCIRMRYDAQDPDSDSGSPEHNPDGSRRRGGTSTFKNTWGKDADMTDFLINSGMDPQAVKDAKARLRNRKISSKEEREYHDWLYSTVTPEKIHDPNFNLKEVLERVSAHNAKSEKFVITASSIFQGPKK